MTDNQRKTFLQLTFGAPDKLALPFWKASPGEWNFKYGNSIEDLDLDEKTLKTDLVYLRMAEIWGTNSHCNRMQVGCLMVKDKSIISDGYNGSPSGFPNQCGMIAIQPCRMFFMQKQMQSLNLPRAQTVQTDQLSILQHLPALNAPSLLFNLESRELYLRKFTEKQSPFSSYMKLGLKLLELENYKSKNKENIKRNHAKRN
jgi:hypothetical protein